MTPSFDWKNATDQQILDADLIIALGMEAASDSEKSDLLNAVTTTLQKAITLRVLKDLPADQKPQLDQLLETGPAEAVDTFIQSHIPTFESLVEEETIKIKRVMLTGDIPAPSAPLPSIPAA